VAISAAAQVREVLLAVLLAMAPLPPATVLSIGDGDTIRVSEAGRTVVIRLACIDAPELAQRPHGEQSRRLLSRLAPVGSRLSLRVLTRDRYGRTVAELFRGPQNLNVQMLRRGQAFAYRQYLHQCDAAAYLGAERGAEFDRLGVWDQPGGITRPWDFRHGRSKRGPGSGSPSGRPGSF
jgi:endonuclease YncB( thermonuclease family)